MEFEILYVTLLQKNQEHFVDFLWKEKRLDYYNPLC